MGIIDSLFVKTKREIGGFKMDAVLREAHSNTIRTTKNPVEFGADITDHSIIEPVQLEIEGVVSDTPMGLAALGELVNFGSKKTRSQQAYEKFIEMMNTRELVEVFTKLVAYKNMLITNVNVSQDKDTSKIVLFNISLREVRVVMSEVALSFNLSPDLKTAAAISAEGTKTATAPGGGTVSAVSSKINSYVG